MTQTVSPIRSQAQPLSVPRGAALYVGALLGPGLLLLPGLAAAQAGPASILAWLALLGISALLAVVFAALGKAFPSAGGVTGYAAAGLGPRAGAAAGWCFLAGVICGAPVVCLIGASYVADLTGGGQSVRCGVAAALLLVVLGLALGGVRATTTVQLVLVALLITVVIIAVAGSAPSAHAANWAPFAPHGWPAIGRAASTLMLSFVGWEAVAPLTSRFGDPARQLPRVIAIAFAITTALYLGLAVATIAVLGPGAGTEVPLADLLRQAVGSAGRAAAAVAAVVLTLGATNSYLSGAAAMAAELTGRRGARREPDALQQLTSQRSLTSRPRLASWKDPGSTRPLLALIAAAGLLVIGLYAVRIVSTAQLVEIPTTLFLAVYLACTLSAVRTLAGGARRAALPAVLAVGAVLLFSGWALAIAAAVAVTAALRYRPPQDRRWASAPGGCAPAARPAGSLRLPPSGAPSRPAVWCRGT
jgi:amino acid efflux transporter